MAPPDVLKAEIDRLCETPAFRNSRVQQKLLRFLAAEAMAGRGRELNQYLIATEGLGLGEKFDPTSDSKVRVLGGRLRRMLADQYRKSAGRKSALRVVLPERSFCPVFETPRGVRKIPSPKAGPPTVAVVEFRGLGLRGAWRHYPAVLAENLMAAVAAMQTVEATGPFIRHGRKNPVTAARESGADFILDGSVESAGSGLRLRARLLRGSNGAVIWAENFDVKIRGRRIPRADFPVVKRLASVLGDDFSVVRRELLQTSLGAAQETVSGQEALLLTWHSWMTMAPRDAKAASRAMRTALRRGEAGTVVKAHAAMGLLHEWADLPRADAPPPKAALALAKGWRQKIRSTRGPSSCGPTSAFVRARRRNTTGWPNGSRAVRSHQPSACRSRACASCTKSTSREACAGGSGAPEKTPPRRTHCAFPSRCTSPHEAGGTKPSNTSMQAALPNGRRIP